MEGMSLQTVYFVGTLLGGMAGGAAIVFGFGWRIYASLAKRIETLDEEFQEYKQHVAEHYASKTGVTTSISELKDTLQSMRDNFDRQFTGMTTRIDKLIDMQVQANKN